MSTYKDKYRWNFDCLCISGTSFSNFYDRFCSWVMLEVESGLQVISPTKETYIFVSKIFYISKKKDANNFCISFFFCIRCNAVKIVFHADIIGQWLSLFDFCRICDTFSSQWHAHDTVTWLTTWADLYSTIRLCKLTTTDQMVDWI